MQIQQLMICKSVITMQNMFYICASIGAIATAISLIYLFIKDYKKNNRISNLERVAEVLEKDLTIRYQPHLWMNGVALRSKENTVSFNLNNKREWCKILEFNIVSGDLELDEINVHLPWELEPKFHEFIMMDTTSRYIFTKNKSRKPLKEVSYEINIIYEDRLDNKYITVLSGTGEKCTLSQPETLK